MKEIFKQLIVDFHKSKLPRPGHRNFELPKLPNSVRKANVFIGMRRSGKTWALYQHMQSLLAQNVKMEQILYLNFEDERLPIITSKELQKILDAYFELYPQYINKSNVYFFFDEIQEISGWEKFIRRLLDTEKMEIYITGSSAKMLSKEIASSLRGRCWENEIFPFSFAEYIKYFNDARNFYPDDKSDDGIGFGYGFTPPLSTDEQWVIKHRLQDFLRYGGFPEAAAMGGLLGYSGSNNQFRELLQGYVNSVIQRDIIERHDLKNPVLVREFCNICLKNSAKLFSVNKVYNDFKSRGRKVSKQSLYNLMDYFEDAYCIFSVSVYNFSARKAANTEKKIYSIDQGLITAYTIKEEYEDSTRLETAVFSHLRRNYKDIYYYKTEQGKEVDFLIIDKDGKPALYQVALNLSTPETLRREISALEEAMKIFKLNTSIIVTIDDEREIKVKSGEIQCIPFWKFLLGFNDKKTAGQI